jgi:hypothetical protein
MQEILFDATGCCAPSPFIYGYTSLLDMSGRRQVLLVIILNYLFLMGSMCQLYTRLLNVVCTRTSIESHGVLQGPRSLKWHFIELDLVGPSLWLALIFARLPAIWEMSGFLGPWPAIAPSKQA